MRFITGCLYWSTSSAKACRSPRWTRSMSLAPGSRLAAMGVHVNKNRKSHKVALLVNRAINIQHRTSNAEHRTQIDTIVSLGVGCWMFCCGTVPAAPGYGQPALPERDIQFEA